MLPFYSGIDLETNCRDAACCVLLSILTVKRNYNGRDKELALRRPRFVSGMILNSI